MFLGIDRLLDEEDLRNDLKNKRIALLGNQASITSRLQHSLDALMKFTDLQVSCVFGPQHGVRGEKQDNMNESEDFIDPKYKIPVFSLYGNSRKPTKEMIESFDLILIDIQDIGTRVYTFITTLKYMLEACSKLKKKVWILDRPNPAGRIVEGSKLQMTHESFVGVAPIPMRHGLTIGEMAAWLTQHFSIDIELTVIAMRGYDPNRGPGYGWPVHELSWVNPSPNASTYFMPRVYPGSVMIEGTHFSEGRGTTRPLELVGAPDINAELILKRMKNIGHDWLRGCALRICYFEPTFNKHQGKLCQGFQVHVDHPSYVHNQFTPYRLFSLFLKSVRLEYPNYNIWRKFEYEYEKDKLAIDIITGGPQLREWVDDPKASLEKFDAFLQKDENAWIEERKSFLIY